MKRFKTYFNLEPYWLFYLTPSDYQSILYNTEITYHQALDKKQKLTGNSRFLERDKMRLYRDQLIGQHGNMVLNKMLYGPVLGPKKYQETRDYANAHPEEGDKGKDCPDYQIDIKGSGWHYNRKGILEVPDGLLNRDEEWGRERIINGTKYPEEPYWPDQLYVHFFIQTGGHLNNDHELCHVRPEGSMVIVTGWIWGTEITHVALGPQWKYRKCDGAYCTPIPELHPLTTFPIRDIWWIKNGMKKEIRNV